MTAATGSPAKGERARPSKRSAAASASSAPTAASAIASRSASMGKRVLPLRIEAMHAAASDARAARSSSASP
jgi:hypothetical protein